MSKKQDKVKTKNSFFDRMLNRIEVVGNRLPDPIVLFAIMALAILVISALSSFFNVSAISPVDGEEIIAKNLLSRDGILEQLTGMVKTLVTSRHLVQCWSSC